MSEKTLQLFEYLKNLAQSLPADKIKAMEAQGISERLDSIIKTISGRNNPPPSVETEICGVKVSARLAKLIALMKREKQHVG